MENNPEATRRAPKRRLRPIIGLLAVLVIAALGFFAWRYVNRPHPEVAVREFVQAVKSGDENRIKAGMATSDLQLFQMYSGMYPGAADKLPEYLSMVREYFIGKDFVEGKDFVLEVSGIKRDKETNCDVATVSLKAGPGLDGNTRPAKVLKSMKDGIPFRVTKEEKTWKVNLVATYPALIGPLQRQGISLGDMSP